MRNITGGFQQWLRASEKQMALYEESKNKDYTRTFSNNADAIRTDFKRQNYFLLRDESFQTKQGADFSHDQIEQLKLKIENISKSKPLSNLISAIGGQAFQAPLSVLEFLNFNFENESIALLAKFDLSLYYQCNEALRYINLNFCYGIKNPRSNKNYILDRESQLIEISDQECQCLSWALNALSNDVQVHLGRAINARAYHAKPSSSAEKVAWNITRMFHFADKIDLQILISRIEFEIRPLILEYLLSRRESIIWTPGSNEEVASLDKLRRMRFKAIQGGGDHMEFFRDWSHLQVRYPRNNFDEIKNQWFRTHQVNDILIICSPGTQKWQAYKINENKNMELWKGVSAPLLDFVLSEVTPQNVEEFDYTILRDLLGINTRAVRQIDLVLASNSEAIKNEFGSENDPLSKILRLKKSLSSEDRESSIKRIFASLLREELEYPGFIRDHVSMKKLKEALKFLATLLQNESLLNGLTNGEFLQWVRASILIFFESLKQLGGEKDFRVHRFYKMQFLPKIEQARHRLFSKRRKWLAKILKMELNPQEISRFSRSLVREANKIFMNYKAGYANLSEAFYALYAEGLAAVIDNLSDVDELIYRLTYMKAHDSINADFIEILLYEAIHIKISQESNWSPRVADIFRLKDPRYFEQTRKILEEVEEKIKIRIQQQVEEREKALAACEEIRQKASEFSKFKVGSEHYVAGVVMHKIADDLTLVVLDHYKSHRAFSNDDEGAGRDQARLISKLNTAIDLRISQEDSLKNFEGLGQKIKTQVLNLFLVIFTLGIFPLARKFILKKPAFFSSVKNEIAEEARVILCQH